MKEVILFGSTNLATMLYYDAAGRDDFKIACLAVEKAYLRGRTEHLGLPVVVFEEVQDLFPPDEYDMMVLFHGQPRVRERGEKFALAKGRGYLLRNYVSRGADVTPDLTMGENNIIQRGAHVGFGGTMGHDNLIRQMVYLGHEFQIGSHNTFVAGSIIGGNCRIGDHCFFGLGAIVLNWSTIASDSFIGAGSTVIKNTEPFSKNVGNPSRIIGCSHEGE